MAKNRAEDIIHLISSSSAIILEGAISVMSALSSDDSRILKIILKEGAESRSIKNIRSCAKAKNIEAIGFGPDEMGEFERGVEKFGFYSLGKTHGGIFAIAKRRKFLTPQELIRSLPKDQKYISIAVIEGIEDPYNLGYAARAVYTQGTDALILPERDFGFSEATIEKASTGTFSKLPVAVFSSDKNSKTELADMLKAEGFAIYCMEKNAKSRDIFEVEFAEKAVFVIGGEKRGISGDFLRCADEIVKIPYAKPFAHSLAAQSAATVVSYEIHRQRAGRRW
ncbi:MAG: hypothetical protein FWG34_08455 [Oscillospiraceae bacterium]|nr:hypothetical protein [Oscillospiraceae bacterium]